MARNRSEKVPFLEGVHQDLVDILIANAEGLHADGVPVSDVRSGTGDWPHERGSVLHRLLPAKELIAWLKYPASTKRTFVADYMEFLYGS